MSFRHSSSHQTMNSVVPSARILPQRTVSLWNNSNTILVLGKFNASRGLKNSLKLCTSNTRFMIKSSWLSNFGFSAKASSSSTESDSIALGPDTDIPGAGLQFATFGGGCFWGVELAYQRVPGVVRTEVGYTQGKTHNPSYEDVCSGQTGHNECVRVEYDPNQVPYSQLLDVLWSRIDPTTLNRQGGDRGTQYRSGIYVYTPEQEKAARESIEKEQLKYRSKIVTEILPAKKWYRAENYHQQYLAKGGRMGFKQSAEKGCSDPIRCYG